MTQRDTHGPAVLEPNALLAGRYRLVRKLGQGGMATQYLVQDAVSGSELALKLLQLDSVQALSAFRDEFSVLCNVEHPCLTRVHDFASERHADRLIHYYTADYVDGQTLERFAASQSLATRLKPLRDAICALGFLHGLGIRHGDVKSGNILVDAQGRGVLIDLGCARRFDATDPSLSGTPEYLAPELLQHGRGDARADLYALGVTLRKLVRGVADLPRPLEQLIDRLTDSEPRRRPAEAREVLEILGEADPAVLALLSAPQGRVPGLLGRRTELALFDEMLAGLQAREAGVRALYLAGPDGIGRTRLLNELKWNAQQQCRVVGGSYLQADPAASMLWRALDDGTDRATLPARPGLEAFVEMALRIAEAISPVVLVLDDAHRLHHQARVHFEAVLRSLPADGRLFVLAAGRPPPDNAVLGEATQVLSLAPLAVEDVNQWARSASCPVSTPDLMRFSGGYPAYIEIALARLGSGQISAAQLASAEQQRAVEGLSIDLSTLTEREQRALAELAVREGPVQGQDMSVPVNVLWGLVHKGWVASTAMGLQLARAADAPLLCRTLPGDLVREIHLERAKQLEATEREGDLTTEAAILWHLIQAADDTTAEQRFGQCLVHARGQPSLTLLAPLKPTTSVGV